MSYPGRSRPFLTVGAFLGIGVAGSILFGIIASNIGGIIAAAIFAVAFVPTMRRALDKKPALILDSEGVNARASGLKVPWSSVTGIRHDAMPTPGTGARGFLILRLTPDAELDRSSFLAPRIRTTKEGPEVWISLTGVDANPGDIVDAARAEHAASRR